MLGPILDILALHGDRPQPIDVPRGWKIGPFQWVSQPLALGPGSQEVLDFRDPASMVDPQIRQLISYGPGNSGTPEDPNIFMLVTGISVTFLDPLTTLEKTELNAGLSLEFSDEQSTVYVPCYGALRSTERAIAGAGGAATNEFEGRIGYSRATLGAILPVTLKNQRLRLLYGLDPGAANIPVTGARVLTTVYGAARAAKDGDLQSGSCATAAGVGASQREARALPSPLLPGQT